MRPMIILLIFIILHTTVAIALQLQLHIIGEPELSSTDIVAVRDERTGQFCSAIQLITDLEGFGYSSDIGVVRVDFSRPGKDMVFLLPEERILEIYHPDYQPLKIILSEIGIQLQPKQVWIIKVSGDKKAIDGIPILIETNTDSVEITIDGTNRGIKQALIVTTGRHEIQLSKPNYETIIDTILVAENNKQFKYIMLIDLVMVFVKGGTFKMGDTFGDGADDEKPVHKVIVSDFYIGKYEVTNAQFCKFLNAKGKQEEDVKSWLDINSFHCFVKKNGDLYVPKSDYENYPVVEVTWYGAKAYCEWAGGRLPTEAEWEYACRGGFQSSHYIYSGSNSIEEVAWYFSNSDGYEHIVGLKKPNELGIYDMSGNVDEWCWDWYDENYYQNSPESNPQGPSSGVERVCRGGCKISYAEGCFAANRHSDKPFDPILSFDIGFRLARSVQ